MKLNRKIKAFTIGEVMVALIISSIVIGLAYTILSLVQKQMHGIQANYNRTSQLNLLESSLWLDFNRFSNIKFNAVENELKFSTAIDSMSYKFEKEYVIKNTDTFFVKLQEKSIFLNGNSTEKGMIDALKLETSKELLNQILFIYKKNDATLYMN